MGLRYWNRIKHFQNIIKHFQTSWNWIHIPLIYRDTSWFQIMQYHCAQRFWKIILFNYPLNEFFDTNSATTSTLSEYSYMVELPYASVFQLLLDCNFQLWLILSCLLQLFIPSRRPISETSWQQMILTSLLASLWNPKPLLLHKSNLKTPMCVDYLRILVYPFSILTPIVLKYPDPLFAIADVVRQLTSYLYQNHLR